MKWYVALVVSLWSVCTFGHVPKTPLQTESPLVDSTLALVPMPEVEVLKVSEDKASKGSEVDVPKVPEVHALEARVRTGEARPEFVSIQGDIGLALTLGAGLNICVPRGDASCTDLLPGPFFSAGVEYRFWRMGIGLNYAMGRYFPIGTGAQNVSVSTEHLTFDILGYFPIWKAFEPFAAVGLGYGQLLSKDGAQQSRVEWSSLWQTAHLRAGVRHRLPASWQLHSGWFWTLYTAAYLHQGGERCVFYNAQGACRLTEEFSGGDTDYATSLELGGQLGFGF